jgi:hypothetical protein
MNISLALIDAIRRFAARRGLLRVVEKRTYVFILVPFNFRGNSHATSAELEQRLIDISGSADDSRTNALFSTLGPFNPAGSSTTAERDLNNPPELNYELMWTWFLPNPWPPNKSKWNHFFGQQAA